MTTDSDYFTLENARQAIRDLFDLMSLRRVVVVDDVFSASSDANVILGYCRALINKGFSEWDKIAEFSKIDFQGDEDLALANVTDVLDDLDADQRRLVSVKLADVSDTSDDSETRSLQALESLLSDFELHLLSLSDWQAKKEKFLSEESIKETLFLFDQDMSADGGRDSEGIHIISNLLKSSFRSSLFCGLLSHTVPAGHEFDVWTELAKEHNIEHKDRFAVVSKAHLREDVNAFAFRLKRVAITPLCDDVKKIVCSLIKESYETAKTELDALNIYDFEQIVFQSSHSEGVWEPETLIRLFNLYNGQSARELANRDIDLRVKSDSIRRIVKIPYRPLDAPESTSKKIRNLELYESGIYINTNHFALELGDVFQKETGKRKFVLVGQPCDLMVRSNGKRCVDEAWLAEICKKPTGNLEAYFELPFYGEDEELTSHWVKLNGTTSVPLSTLDLCVFHEHGLLEFNVDSVTPPNLVPAWCERFAIIRDSQKRVYEQLARLKVKSENVSKEFLTVLTASLTKSVSGIMNAEVQQTRNTIKYDLKRVGRLRAPLANALLRAFARYLSREAYEHDITRSIHNTDL